MDPNLASNREILGKKKHARSEICDPLTCATRQTFAREAELEESKSEIEKQQRTTVGALYIHIYICMLYMYKWVRTMFTNHVILLFRSLSLDLKQI
jgi:hypothetical protein